MKEIVDRGIIKWQPFNSCFDSKILLKDLNKEKNRKDYPILSDDQLKIIEEKVLEAYELKILVKVYYYYDGYINTIDGKINGLNMQEKLIYLNQKRIYFKQILKIITD